ncbi:hypothetical protein J5N97_025014 [Dioscorea zingiberensis]|uniref:Large ribosomal subunit protein uL6 alpha-beta domain-containing protein n=1 Tax=Dioscorea zingiberensis TaxID=325984 RepID=A0A9D5C928_9LILI|nr:hypothetical protein J5N97_025014 [Dioscorea zingiberensis]
MKTIRSSQTMDIPEGVKVRVKAKLIEVEGPRGKLTRNFKHLNLDLELIDGGRKLKADAWFGSHKTMAAIRMPLSHVQNLITGVTKGYRYKMRFVYAHFPINSSITNSSSTIEIRNFLGEKKVRKVDMLEGVYISRFEKVKDELILDGNDVELVSRSAALINQKCHVKNKDIRKFLDGIYVSEKDVITIVSCEVLLWLFSLNPKCWTKEIKLFKGKMKYHLQWTHGLMINHERFSRHMPNMNTPRGQVTPNLQGA